MQNQTKKPKKTILIIVIVLILVCCLCTAAVAAGAGGFALTKNGTIPDYLGILPTETPTPTATPTEVPPTPEPKATKTPAMGEATSQSPSIDDISTLGISRAEMIAALNGDEVFTFEDPIEVQGTEIVMGTHSWLCVQGDCASISMMGPEDDLIVISLAVPLDPNDNDESSTAIALMMNVTTIFAKNDSDLAFQMMTDIMNAESNGSSFDQNVAADGYTFNYNYDPTMSIASLTVTK
jgi:hypothetical protein